MTYSAKAMEWAMKIQEVLLRALSGRQTWLQVADVLGLSPRTVRRLRWRYEHYGRNSDSRARSFGPARPLPMRCARVPLAGSGSSSTIGTIAFGFTSRAWQTEPIHA